MDRIERLLQPLIDRPEQARFGVELPVEDVRELFQKSLFP